MKIKRKHIGWLLTAIFAPLFVAYFSGILTLERPPSFRAKNPIMNLDSVLIIQAENRQAQNNDPLLISFDNILFEDIATLCSDSSYTWTVDLKKIDTRLTSDGKHKIEAGFKSNLLAKEFTIIIDTKIPGIKTSISGDSLQKNLTVMGISSANLYLDTLIAEVVFFYKGKEQKINVPVTKVVQQNTGELVFEFETKLQGFPKFLESDPEFIEPFFGFKLTDLAGNSYYSIQSYAEFLAPGEKVFGVSNVGKVSYSHDVDDFDFLTSNFKIEANNKAFRKLPTGEPAITLVVKTKLGNNQRELNWKSKLSETQPLTLIYRDEKQIGSTFEDKYIDNIPKELIVDYRVEQVDAYNDLYTSNVVNSISKSKVQFDSLSNELIIIQGKISEKTRTQDSLNNVFRAYNKTVRRSLLPTKIKGYVQKDLAGFADLHLSDTLHINKTNTILLNFYDPKITNNGTPIEISLKSGDHILQTQTYELKQFNKIKIAPNVTAGKNYKLLIGIFFKDQWDDKYPPFYRIERDVVVN